VRDVWIARHRAQGLDATRVDFGEILVIEDLGNHSAATVISLGILLAGTAHVTPDPKRENFYEVAARSSVHYIHVSPLTGTIYLLASWGATAKRSLAFEEAVSGD
jgi:hypothetical protein